MQGNEKGIVEHKQQNKCNFRDRNKTRTKIKKKIKIKTVINKEGYYYLPDLR